MRTRNLRPGIREASVDAPAHAEAVNTMLPQLLIALVKRNGGKLTIPAAEIDATGNDLLAFRVDPEKLEFHFEIQKKR
jgi:hypothetical protein